MGRYVSPNVIHNANGVLNYLHVGWWMQNKEFTPRQRCANRTELHTLLGTELANVPVTYLEFGVFRGESLRLWSALLRNSESELHGFDSFEGLPESWVSGCDKGAFALNGNIPQFEDPRVKLHQGWFSNTLPPFLQDFHPKEQLVVHLDADLYSSTIFVLQQLQGLLRSGTLLIFDEFFDRNHELKALAEFLGDHPSFQLDCLAATEDFVQVAFRVR